MTQCKECSFDLDGNYCPKCDYFERAQEERAHWEIRDKSEELKERW